jgi:hypothetical protein
VAPSQPLSFFSPFDERRQPSMPSDKPLGSTYDSSIIQSTGSKPITLEDQKAHEDALEQQVPLAQLVGELKQLEPTKADALAAKLEKFEAGKLNAQGTYSLIKMTVGLPQMQTAFEKLVPGFDRKFCMPGGFQHPPVC